MTISKNTMQPNFEHLKSLFYQAFLNSDKANTIIMMQSVVNADFRSFYKKYNEFKADFNLWLDRLDIRQASTLISILKDNNKTVAGWMANNQYFIDYNDKGALDLIRIQPND